MIAFSGVTFALWSKTLTIQGTVNTGTVDADFDYAISNDPPDTVSNDPEECGSWDFYVDSMKWTGGRYSKDVASCSVSGVGTQTLVITIENAYPCYYASVAFNITNTGTVPVKVKSLKLVKINGTAVDGVDLTNCTTYYIDVENLKNETSPFPEADFSIHLSELAIGQQIDPDKELPGDLCIHLEQGATQDSTYSFEIEIVVAQWNEV
ncbi:hypothetical protein DRN86_04055 [Candidatus Geothermarchaeota archaeon]|nr:MAG: hypothetical protein DRN86_04055 [Candidatus Geothermarchaeota archaeon]